jgi:phosphatidylinositol-3-phosphatase
MTEDAPESFEAKLEQLEALHQALQSKNLELRLRLQQRKSRWAFERRLLAIGGLGLLLLGLVVGLFLGLAVGPVRPLATAAAVWAPDHVVIVIEANLSARNLAPELAYLNSLLHQGANFTNSHGIDHPSQPNYLALFSGDPQGTGSDAKRNPDGSNPIVNDHTQVGTDDLPPNTPLDTPNLGAALIRAGRSFAGYSEDLPIRGFTGVSRTGPPGSGIDYQRKHNPWVNWQAVKDDAVGRNELPSSVNLPFTEFPTDDAGFAKLPTVAFVIPNQIHDGHKSDAAPPGIDYGKAMDDWLRLHIEPYRRWALSHNSMLIITWDEDEDAYTPVKDDTGATVAKRYINLIPTIMVGAGVVAGDYGERIDHYTVLHTIEDFYGLTPLARRDAVAKPITDALRQP